jgi:hypothetical protein
MKQEPPNSHAKEAVTVSTNWPPTDTRAERHPTAVTYNPVSPPAWPPLQKPNTISNSVPLNHVEVQSHQTTMNTTPKAFWGPQKQKSAIIIGTSNTATIDLRRFGTQTWSAQWKEGMTISQTKGQLEQLEEEPECLIIHTGSNKLGGCSSKSIMAALRT